MPSAASFELASIGVVKDDPSIMFEFEQRVGQFCQEPVPTSPAIGSFYDSSGISSGPSMEFRPGIPGTVNEVFVLLKAQTILEPGETITFELPGFSGNSTQNISIKQGFCEGDPVVPDEVGQLGDIVDISVEISHDDAQEAFLSFRLVLD